MWSSLLKYFEQEILNRRAFIMFEYLAFALAWAAIEVNMQLRFIFILHIIMFIFFKTWNIEDLNVVRLLAVTAVYEVRGGEIVPNVIFTDEFFYWVAFRR